MYSTAFLFRTGSTPGMPMQTGQVLRVGIFAEPGLAAAEYLGLRLELGMHFKPDHCLVFHAVYLFVVFNVRNPRIYNFGLFLCHSVACS